jgi:hypothetical protein
MLPMVRSMNCISSSMMSLVSAGGNRATGGGVPSAASLQSVHVLDAWRGKTWKDDFNAAVEAIDLMYIEC